MKTIALITDFGADGFYAGVMRAVVHAAAPNAAVIDVTHGIEPHRVSIAAFVLDCVFDWFAPGTVFVAVVDPGVGGDRRDLIVQSGGRYIVGPDNGIVADVTSRRGLARAVAIDPARLSAYRAGKPRGRTFLGRDVFAPAAAALASGVDAGALGTVVGECAPASWLPDVRVSRGRIDASVRYVDPFGNLMTGVTEAHLEAAFPGLDTSDIEAQLGTRPAGRLRGYYQGGDEGELIAVINSWGRVEVSIDRGRAVDAFPETPPEAMRLELRAAKG